MSSSPTSAAGNSHSGAAAPVEVTMPQMGVSVAEGTIAAWRVAPGERVEADETICEVTTDKVDVEIPAPASGTVTALLAEPGETVAVGEVIAEIDPGAPAAPPQPVRQGSAGNGHAAPTAGSGAEEADRSGIYSPVVRRIAAEHGIDLGEVDGSGVGGRVRKRDLLDHIAAAEGQAGAEHESRPLHTESPYRADEPDQARAGPSSTPPADPLTGAGERQPMSAIRRATAEHMLASRRTSAHCTTITEVDFARVEARRAELAPAMAERGVKLTSLAFVASATVAALAEHPVLNASVEGEDLVFHADVNVAVAVATDAGLLVPVIRRAQRLSLEGMAAEISDLAARARAGELVPDELHGGTFTITNPGQYGSVIATPIINQPQVAILDLEAIVRRPVAVQIDGSEAIAVRPIANLCLSWDHRALDGVEAARFLATVRRHLQAGEPS